MFEVHVQNKLPSNVYFSTSSLFYPFVINYYKENHNNCTFSFNEFRFVTFIAFHSMQKIFILKWIGVFINMLFFASKHKITTRDQKGHYADLQSHVLWPKDSKVFGPKVKKSCLSVKTAQLDLIIIIWHHYQFD